MADDQIEPGKKREIILDPEQDLQPGTTYEVKIAPQLQSKSGATLGSQVTVTFTTAGSTKPSGTKTEHPSVSNADAPNNGQNSAKGVRTNNQTTRVKTSQNNGEQQANSTATMQEMGSSAVRNESPADSGGKAVSAGNKVNFQGSQTTSYQGNTSTSEVWTKAAIVIILVLAVAKGYTYVKRKR